MYNYIFAIRHLSGENLAECIPGGKEDILHVGYPNKEVKTGEWEKQST